VTSFERNLLFIAHLRKGGDFAIDRELQLASLEHHANERGRWFFFATSH